MSPTKSRSTGGLRACCLSSCPILEAHKADSLVVVAEFSLHSCTSFHVEHQCLDSLLITNYVFGPTSIRSKYNTERSRFRALSCNTHLSQCPRHDYHYSLTYGMSRRPQGAWQLPQLSLPPQHSYLRQDRQKHNHPEHSQTRPHSRTGSFPTAR